MSTGNTYISPLRVNVWNFLTEKVVCAPNANAFENRLDKLLANQPMKYKPDVE